MAHMSKHRWIKTLLTESANQIPMLPWERGAKRARRIAANLTEKASALA